MQPAAHGALLPPAGSSWDKLCGDLALKILTQYVIPFFLSLGDLAMAPLTPNTDNGAGAKGGWKALSNQGVMLPVPVLPDCGSTQMGASLLTHGDSPLCGCSGPARSTWQSQENSCICLER